MPIADIFFTKPSTLGNNNYDLHWLKKKIFLSTVISFISSNRLFFLQFREEPESVKLLAY